LLPFFIAKFAVMTKNRINILKGILFIGLSFFLAFNFTNSLNNFVSRLPLGWVVSSIILRLFICIAFARGLMLILKVIKPTINSVLVLSVGLIIGFGVSFITPIYNTDYSEINANDLKLDFQQLQLKANNSIQLNNKPAVVAFFSTSCPHCSTTSKLLGVMANANKGPQVVALFPGNKEDTERFIKQNNAKNFKSILIADKVYYTETTQGSVPSIFLVDGQGNTVKHWSGELSYPSLDYILTYK